MESFSCWNLFPLIIPGALFSMLILACVVGALKVIDEMTKATNQNKNSTFRRNELKFKNIYYKL